MSADIYGDDEDEDEFEFDESNDEDDNELSDYMKNGNIRDEEKQIVLDMYDDEEEPISAMDSLKKMEKAQTVYVHRSQSTADYGINGFGDAGKQRQSKKLAIKVEQVPAKVGWSDDKKSKHVKNKKSNSNNSVIEKENDVEDSSW